MTGTATSASTPAEGLTQPVPAEGLRQPPEARTHPVSAADAEPAGQAAPDAQAVPTAHAVDGVWSASTAPAPAAPRGIRPWSLAWSVLLASVGGLTLATALGARINLATAGISVLADLGVLLLVLALLPQRDRSDGPRV